MGYLLDVNALLSQTCCRYVTDIVLSQIIKTHINYNTDTELSNMKTGLCLQLLVTFCSIVLGILAYFKAFQIYRSCDLMSQKCRQFVIVCVAGIISNVTEMSQNVADVKSLVLHWVGFRI